MDQLAPVADAFDMLDMVLAVFGACIFALWCGRGKKLGGLLSGALVGGLAKPALFMLIGSGVLLATQSDVPKLKQTPEQQDKTLKFWTR